MENLFHRIFVAHFSKNNSFQVSECVCVFAENALIALIYLIMHDNDYFCLVHCKANKLLLK